MSKSHRKNKHHEREGDMSVTDDGKRIHAPYPHKTVVSTPIGNLLSFVTNRVMLGFDGEEVISAISEINRRMPELTPPAVDHIQEEMVLKYFLALLWDGAPTIASDVILTLCVCNDCAEYLDVNIKEMTVEKCCEFLSGRLAERLNLEIVEQSSIETVRDTTHRTVSSQTPGSIQSQSKENIMNANETNQAAATNESTAQAAASAEHASGADQAHAQTTATPEVPTAPSPKVKAGWLNWKKAAIIGAGAATIAGVFLAHKKGMIAIPSFGKVVETLPDATATAFQIGN